MGSTYYVDPATNAVWVADTVYSVDDICVPVQDGGADNKYVYKVKSIAGDEKSGVAEPAWDATPGNDTVDDQVTWTCMAPDSWAEALRSIQGAFDLAAAGDTVYCRGTQTVAAKIDIDTNSGGNATGYIKFIGCNAAGNRDGTRFIIQGNGSDACDLLYKTGAIHMIWLENIELKSAHSTGDGLSTNATYGSGWVFINCCANNNAARGFDLQVWFNESFFFQCCAYSNGTYGFYDETSPQTFMFCSSHNNTGSGWYGRGKHIGGLSYENGNDGYESALASALYYNCVVNANDDDGIGILGVAVDYTRAFIVGCRITNHSGAGDIGINGAGDPFITGYCYFEDNDGDNIQNATLHQFIPIAAGTTTNIEGADEGDTNEGYTDKTTDDFNLRSDATLRRTAITIPLV